MKLLLTGIEHPQKISAWSGTPYFLSQGLRRHFDLSFNGGLRDWRYVPFHLLGRFRAKVAPGTYRMRAEPAVLKVFARRLEDSIRLEKPDVVLSISCEPVAYLKPGPPVYVIHDATFRVLENYYSSFSKLSDRSRRLGEDAFRRSFDRCAGALATSGWARHSAITDYGVTPERAHVFPVGANLPDPPPRDKIDRAIEQRLAEREKHFLFVGVDWERKGGDTAARIVSELVARGIEAKLHVVGCTPPPAALANSFLVPHGFLSKGRPDEAARLRSLFLQASFFLLPSVAECTPCSFAEANAFGIPVLSNDTGGIGEIVRPGTNGFLLSPSFSEEAMVETALGLCREPERYRQLALQSRQEYETRLNWDVYAQRLEKLLLGAK